MKKEAFIISIISAALITFSSFQTELIPLRIAVVAFAAWSVFLASKGSFSSLSILLALQTTIALVNLLYGASTYIVGLAIVLAILSWDWASTERSIANVSSENKSRFCIHHCLQTAIISGLGFALLIIPVKIQIPIGFATALGLSMAGFMLIAVLLKLLAKTDSHPPR
jgi:hypothetical protein